MFLIFEKIVKSQWHLEKKVVKSQRHCFLEYPIFWYLTRRPLFEENWFIHTAFIMKLKKSRLRINAQALLWRILLLHKKHWICTILTIVLPTLLFGILVVISSYLPNSKSQAEDKIYQNEDLFDEIVKKLNTSEKPAVILFTPENNLTRDLTNQINLSLYFLIENVLMGESNFGNYFFKEFRFS